MIKETATKHRPLRTTDRIEVLSQTNLIPPGKWISNLSNTDHKIKTRSDGLTALTAHVISEAHSRSGSSYVMRPLNIAHRGASGHAPENTLAAFSLAIDQGADWIELDLHQTADQHLIVHHDATLKRTAGDPRSIRDLSLTQIRELDIGIRRGPSFRGEMAPTLDEALELAKGKVRVQIEIKRGSAIYPGIEKRILETIKRHEAGAEVSISSFELSSIELLRGMNGSIALGLLTEKIPMEDILPTALSLKVHSIHFSTRRLSKKFVPQAHALGFSVLLYTVDRPSLMRRYLDMGLDGLFTNFPDRLSEVLARRESPSSS